MTPDLVEDISVLSIGETKMASDVILEVKKFITPETLETSSLAVKKVGEYILSNNFNLIVFTGRSGFISQKLLVDLEHIPTAWIEDQQKKYDDPKKLLLILDELGVKPDRCRMVMVDDHMTSGFIKSRTSLIGMSKAGLQDYGFASFTGPFKYQRKPEITYDQAKSLATMDSGELSAHLYFPEIKNQNVWELFSGLERLADYYEKSTLVHSFIDETLENIVNHR